MENIKAGIDEINLLSRAAKEEIEQDKMLIEKYNEQQKNVRNNREFDAISKEIEYQELQIQLSEKHIKEFSAEVKSRKKQMEDTDASLSERKIDLEVKKAELESIDRETAKEIEELTLEESKAVEKIDDRLLAAYRRIRSNVHNGLAVVTVKRDACGGCYNRIPPQRQYEIRQNKKIIVCEYCGRILVSDELAEE
jgi:predicted  nucleic acid-binding Zn-ribbon protein